MDEELRERCVEFGMRLKELRLERGIAQEKLAELAGLDRTYVSQVERGRRNATLGTIHKLAGALGVQPSELMLPAHSCDPPY